MIFLLVGCAADTHSSLTEEMLDNLNDLVSVLQNVQDSSSAQNAIAKIEQINICIKLNKTALLKSNSNNAY